MPASAPYLNKQGKATLDDDVFGQRFNEGLVHECVRAELNARRQGSASTKTRGQVRGGGAKPWRQKGTGRARAGSIRSPLWAGGGVVFGPSPRRYTVKVNRKARRAALRSALSLHAGRESLALVDAGKFSEPSAKQAAEGIDGWREPQPALVVVGPDEDNAQRSFRNLRQVRVLGVDEVGVADVVGAAWLVLSDAAAEQLTELCKRDVRAGTASEASGQAA